VVLVLVLIWIKSSGGLGCGALILLGGCSNCVYIYKDGEKTNNPWECEELPSCRSVRVEGRTELFFLFPCGSFSLICTSMVLLMQF